ncbi:MAG: hypothetical protein Q8O82_01945 [Pseudorhodobacter sp.]|nr:hypothetical protein [Pseudorhodobacter sp.]
MKIAYESPSVLEPLPLAGPLGIAIDAAKALRDGTTPETLRQRVIARASAAALTCDCSAVYLKTDI